MNMKNNQFTCIACYNGYITQAVANMLPALLFSAFRQQFGVSLAQLGLLTVINFGIQIIVDFIGAKVVEHVSTRFLMVLCHSISTAGLIGLGIFPFILPPYAGIALAMGTCAVGSGMLEVLVSPIVESLPGDAKSAAMSLLHSFYCWGCVAVIALSTTALAFGLPWQILPVLWALVPAAGIFMFSIAPLYPLTGEEKSSLRMWFQKPLFWLLMLLMICAGASEQAMSQWASYFAQMGLEINKTVGDLAGPMAFSILMGLSRLMGAKKNARFTILQRVMLSAALCVFSYVLTICSPSPVISLIGCALCGFSVGCMWPGTFSLAAEWFPKSGGMLFALLALGGDLGCAAGPGIVGFVSDTVSSMGEYAALKIGLLAAAAFPVIMFTVLAVRRRILRRAAA